MFGKKSLFRSFAVLVAAMLVLCSIGSAFALEAEEYGAKYMVSDDPSMVDVDIIDFKVRLQEMGFYSAGVSESTLQTRGLDDLTMAAVKLVCTMNPELTFYPEGVSNELYWRVMGLVEQELNTPLDEVYSELKPGDANEDITKVQNRLNQLGYDAVGQTFTPGTYDEALQIVIDEFVRCNKFVYEEQNCIPVEMQELLFSDAAMIYTPNEQPLENKNFSEKVFGYFGATTVVLGMEMTNMVLFIIGFVLVAAIVVLVSVLLAPGKNAEKKHGKNEKQVKMKSGVIEFKIEYGGETYMHVTNVAKKYVRIGRATGDFPLNMSDDSVSRKHCEICYEGGTLMLRDFSSYGTIINGSKCHHTQQALHSGDVLEVGKHRITIRFEK